MVAGALLGLILVAAPAAAQTVPDQPWLTRDSFVIPYRGYLEHNGLAVNGAKTFRFTIYRVIDSASAPGTFETLPVWEEDHVDVPVLGGHFVVELGKTTPFISGGVSVFGSTGATDYNRRLLGVEIIESGYGTATEFAVALDSGTSPGTHQLLGSVPFAYGGAPGQTFAVDGDLIVKGNTTPGTHTEQNANRTVVTRCPNGQYVTGVYTIAGVPKFSCAPL